MAILAVINFSENGTKAFIFIGLSENIEKVLYGYFGSITF